MSLDALGLIGAVLVIALRGLVERWLDSGFWTVTNPSVSLFHRWVTLDLLATLSIVLLFLGPIARRIKHPRRQYRWDLLLLYGIPLLYLGTAPAAMLLGIPYYAFPYFKMIMVLGEGTVHFTASVLLGVACIRFIDCMPEQC